ncbi:hypothetical protein LguiA_022791 [Lonicera macranthoides]
MENKKQEFVRDEMLEIVSNDDAVKSKIQEDQNLTRHKEKLKLDDYVEDHEDKGGGIVLGVEKKDLLIFVNHCGELKIEGLNPKKRVCELDNYDEDREDKEAGVMLGLEKKDLQGIVRVDDDDGELKLEEDVNLKKRKKELDDYVKDQEDKEGGLALDSTSSSCIEKGVARWSRPRLPFTRWGKRDSDSDSDDEEELSWKVYLEWIKCRGPARRELIDNDRGKASEFTKKEVDNVELQPHEYQNLHVPKEELRYCETRRQYYLAGKPVPYRPMTVKEAEVYHQQVRESEGFDCPFMSHTNAPGLRVREILIGENAKKIARYSKLALAYFNNRHGMNYAFERIEKANSHSSSVATYYITFVAKSGETFQARVHEKLKGDIDVLFCRIKPGQCATA